VDDHSFPKTLEFFRDAARRWPDAQLISGMMALDNETGKTVRVERIKGVESTRYFTPEQYLHEYLLEHPANHSLGPCSTYRRSAVEESGGHRAELRHWSDSFIHRSVGLESGMVYIPEIVHSFTMSEGSISHEALKEKPFLDTLQNTINLMRSPQFRERFPDEYIQYWEQGYRQIMYDSVIDDWHTMTTMRNLLLFSAIAKPSLVNKFSGFFASLLMRLEKLLILPRIKNHAARYFN